MATRPIDSGIIRMTDAMGTIMQTPLHLQTPLFEDIETMRQSGRRLLLKMDCFQPVGSFKIRGIGRICQQRIAAGARMMISSSGGNAGYAVAYAADRLGVGATVVLPKSTPQATADLLVRWNAKVIVHGESWDEADARARSLVQSGNEAYISPFDDPAIWDGHSTLVDEIPDDEKPDAIVLSVGGGGLMCGVLEGLQRRGWSDVRLVAVETEGADSLSQSIRAGEPITLPQITSIAKSLGAKRVADETFRWTQRRPVESVVVSDRAAVEACQTFANRYRVLVEPACGASLAFAFNQSEHQRVIAIVCGGINTNLSQMQRWSQEFLTA